MAGRWQFDPKRLLLASAPDKLFFYQGCKYSSALPEAKKGCHPQHMQRQKDPAAVDRGRLFQSK